MLSNNAFKYAFIYSSSEVYARKCKQVNILPLGQRFILNDLILFHKIVNHLIPTPKMPSYLSLFSGNSRLRSCHLDRLCFVSSVIPRGSSSHNLNKSFFYRSHILWNSLPLDIRETMESSIFKLRLKQHLWKHVMEEIADDESNFSIPDTSIT